MVARIGRLAALPALALLVVGLAAPLPPVSAVSATRPDPTQGPGGPVLVVPGTGGFGGYVAEILRAEGLDEFDVRGRGHLSAGGLSPYRALILGRTTLTAGQARALTQWVTDGGDLVALRPSWRLTRLLGLTHRRGSLAEGYLRVDTSRPPGAGIFGRTMQFHGTADLYGVAPGTRVVARLYATATRRTAAPAVTVRRVGSLGGSAAAFTYDLARSVVLTRQGNPAWAGQHRDGQPGANRSDNLFFGAAAGDVRPDYVDPARITVPQADEQQRLLANVLTRATLDTQPLPRFWYLPHGAKAAIVMTSDNHGSGSVTGRFDREVSVSRAGCSVADWQCVRSTSYLYPGYPRMSDAQARAYQAQGFEIALHVTTECLNYDRAAYASALASQLAALASAFPSVAPPATSRNHCAAWIGYTTVPEELARQGIHLDTDYYYWPPSWVRDVPGLFTGSGFAQRFATSTGRLIDVYQATTQMTDESGQSYPFTVKTLLDRALGPQGFYGTFVANIHSDGPFEATAVAVEDTAQQRGVPVISARQLLTWTDARNASSFDRLRWSARRGRLGFRLHVAPDARGLEAMLPRRAGGVLTSLVGPSGAVPITTRVVKGTTYVVFPAQSGAWTARYAR